MGHFLAASAFRTLDVDGLSCAIAAFSEQHGARANVVAHAHPVNDHTDALLYSPENGWSVVLWPSYFNVHDVPACLAISSSLHIAAVSVSVYDGDFWSMRTIDEGRLVDFHSSWGDYFSESEDDAIAAREHWKGRPEEAARVIGCPGSILASYCRHVGPEETGKVFPDDEFELADFWVFTDLWRRIGIRYPSNPETFTARVRFGRNFADHLPMWDGEHVEPAG